MKKNLFLSLFLLILASSLLVYQLSKAPKEVKAVVGTLNINTTTPGTTNFPGNGVWTSAGNVGIGTTGPIGKLQINGNWSGSQPYVLVNAGSGQDKTPQINITQTSSLTTAGDMVGLNLHNDSATDNTYTPLITFSRRSNATYNSSLAAIGAHTPGIGLDVNWLKGNLIFYTMPANAYGLQERMRIQYDGNVGIGTTGPGAPLDVKTAAPDGSNISAIRISEAAGAATGRNSLEFWNGNVPYTKARLYTQVGSAYNATQFYIDVADSARNLQNRFTIDVNGNVGIGTTSPSTWQGAAVTVVSQYSSSGNTVYSLQSNTTTVDQGGIFEGYSNAVTSGSKALGSIAFLRENTSTIALSSYTGFYTNNAGAVGEKVRITSAGNVGIGTTGPPRKLSVYASSGSAAPFILATNDYNNVNIGSMFAVEFGAASGNTFSSLVALSAGGTAWNNLILQYGGGNVGIGTTNPTTKLNIYNTTFSDDLLVNNTATNGQASVKLAADTRSWVIGAAGSANTNTGGNNFFVWDITGATARLVINTSGKVGIGTTGPTARLHVVGITGEATTAIIGAFDGSYKSDWPGGWGGGLATWDVVGSSAYFSQYLTRSDISKKDKITSLDYGLQEIMRLKPAKFHWKPEYGDPTKTNIGFIAQEMESVIPELVTGDEGNKGIEYSQLTTVLVKAIQEQQGQISSHDNKLKELTDKVEGQQKTIEDLERQIEGLKKK